MQSKYFFEMSPTAEWCEFQINFIRPFNLVLKMSSQSDSIINILCNSELEAFQPILLSWWAVNETQRGLQKAQWLYFTRSTKGPKWLRTGLSDQFDAQTIFHDTSNTLPISRIFHSFYLSFLHSSPFFQCRHPRILVLASSVTINSMHQPHVLI